MEEGEEGVVDSDIDCLPFDCLVCICEYLSPKDLCRFGAVCKLFHEASLVAHLWRYHCLMRWTFCDIFQIPEGEQRWRRYFMARRKVDASMDAGRPTRDYRLKTLRGHQSDIISAEVVGGSGVNWEDPKPPLVVSLSMDKTAKAWDVLQGKAVWSREGDVTSISADRGSGEVAVGLSDGRVILLDSASEWEEQAAFQITPDQSPVRVVKYGRVKQSNLPKPFLMIVSDNQEGTEVWGALPATTDDAGGVGCLFSLRTPHHDPRSLQLCEASGLLAVPRITAPDIDVWNLLVAYTPSAHSSPPLHPHLTVRTTSSCIPQWLSPGLLATRGGMATLNPWVRADAENKIELWDVLGEMKSKKKAVLSLNSDDDNIKLYNSTRTITCHAPPRALSAAKNGLLLVGELDGTLEVFDLTCCMRGGGKGEGEGSTASSSSAVAGQACLQKFADHKGAIMDMYADSFRVLTCSKDYSIRVYRWRGRGASSAVEGKGKGEGSSSATLESRYTLLGGSVAMKTHDGFNEVLCEAGNCIGVAGNQLKFYNFTCKFENPLASQ